MKKGFDKEKAASSSFDKVLVCILFYSFFSSMPLWALISRRRNFLSPAYSEQEERYRDSSFFFLGISVFSISMALVFQDSNFRCFLVEIYFLSHCIYQIHIFALIRRVIYSLED